MNRTTTLAIAVVIFATGMVGGRWLSSALQDAASVAPIATAHAGEAGPGLKKRRPDFTLPDLDGTPRNVNEWNGKVLVVNFWATWCTPCRKEIPAFNELQAKYAERGVQFIGIALDDINAVKRFMERIPIEYPVLIGEDTAIPIAKAYGNAEGVLPYTVFVDRTGNIASVAQGGLNEEVTEKTLAKLF